MDGFVRIRTGWGFHQCIKETDILISRVIIDKYLSLYMLLDLLYPLCALKTLSTCKIIISYPMANLHISNNILLKPAHTE